jgi:hypothetical protein
VSILKKMSVFVFLYLWPTRRSQQVIQSIRDSIGRSRLSLQPYDRPRAFPRRTVLPIRSAIQSGVPDYRLRSPTVHGCSRGEPSFRPVPRFNRAFPIIAPVLRSSAGVPAAERSSNQIRDSIGRFRLSLPLVQQNSVRVQPFVYTAILLNVGRRRASSSHRHYPPGPRPIHIFAFVRPVIFVILRLARQTVLKYSKYCTAPDPTARTNYIRSVIL